MTPHGLSRQQVERLVRVWQRRLGLDSWQLELIVDDVERWSEFHDGRDTSTVHASTWRARDYEDARLYLNPAEWRTWDRRRLEQLIVHELLHLVTRDVEFILDQLEGLLHRDVDDLIAAGHRHAVEGAVDRLAFRLVDLVAELGPR